MATLEIRRNADGLVRRDPDLWKWYDDDFIWADGNYSCDCNRYHFWCKAGNESEVDDENAPEHACGDERYSVRLTDPDGKVLYEDGDWPS